MDRIRALGGREEESGVTPVARASAPVPSTHAFFAPKSLPLAMPPAPSVTLGYPLVGLVSFQVGCVTTRTRYVPAARSLKDQLPLASLVTLFSPLCQMPSALASMKTRQPDRPPSPAFFDRLPSRSSKTLPLMRTFRVLPKFFPAA